MNSFPRVILQKVDHSGFVLTGSLNANLSARTSNGRIHSEVEVVTNRIGANFLEGKIGTGGPAIELRTSNGAIYLKNGRGKESVNSIFKPGEVK